MDNPVAANILGTIGAIGWSVSQVPQIVINYRRHNTTGLQQSMMLLWAIAGVPLGVYNIVEDFNVALKVQPQLLTLLSLVTWMQCFYYDRRWSFARCTVCLAIVAIAMGGLQAGLVFGLRSLKDRGVEWPLTLMAILSSILLGAGVLRHYLDIYQHRTVRGISFIFVSIDCLGGDLCSLLSLFFEPKLSILGLAIYGSELFLWTGVYACGIYFNLAPYVQERFRSTQNEPTVPTRPGSRLSHTLSSAGNSQALSLHRLPSSTSVFRTPSRTSSLVMRAI